MTTDRIAETFGRLKAERKTGLVLFLTAGFPDMEATMELVPALVEAGADVIELGVPFSDPLADGVTIQSSSYAALQQGVTLRGCLDLVGRLRPQVAEVPLMLMGYYNPIYSYGLSQFAADASGVGLDGVIVADMPEEESAPLRSHLAPRHIHLVPLFAPTSTEARIEAGCRHASGFIYCVSLTGVTGSRDELASGMGPLVRRVRQHSSLPLAVGFGISRREHVEAIGQEAEAAVVGSALIRVLMDAPRDRLADEARDFVAGLRGLGLAPSKESAR